MQSVRRSSSEVAIGTSKSVGGQSSTSVRPEQSTDAACEVRNVVSGISKPLDSVMAKSASSIVLQRLSSADINRRCWICYACENDEDAPADELVNPCGCKGSTKWVHQMCINQWIDEVQDGNASKEIRCPYCTNYFSFEFPTPSMFIRCLSNLDACYTGFCNSVMSGQWFSLLGFTAIATSATNIFKLQLKEVISLLKKGSDSTPRQLALAMGLQMVVPTSLILLEQQFSCLEDRMARLLPSSTPSTMNLRATAPPHAEEDDDGIDNLHQVIGALLFPVIADSVGTTLYGSIIDNSFRRYLMGSFTYVICRSIVKIFYKREQMNLQRNRRVKNRHS